MTCDLLAEVVAVSTYAIIIIFKSNICSQHFANYTYRT